MDIMFASFIRKASDVLDIRKELGKKGEHIKIVSKVCASTRHVILYAM